MFSAEDQKKILQWFKQIVGSTKQCPGCGQIDRAFSHPDLVCLPVAASGQEKSLQHAHHFLVRECGVCGYTMLFNADRIGIQYHP